MFFHRDKWKIKYKELEKEYNKLLKNYKSLYSRLNSPVFMRWIIKNNLNYNSSNIRNFNYKDRKYRTRKYVCFDGQKVRSKVEREIYNYLLLNGVKVRYEAVYKTPWGSIIRPDFYLPEYKVYIEYFGKDEGEDQKYDEIMRFKKELYKFSTAPFIILNHHDDEDLYNAVKSKLSPYIDVSLWF